MVTWSNNKPQKEELALNWSTVAYAVALGFSVLVLPITVTLMYINHQSENTLAEFAPSGVQDTIDCVAALDVYAANATIYFDLNSWNIPGEDKAVILQISDQLERCPEAVVYVYGHADGTGSDSINERMSWRRAEEVIGFLSSEERDTVRYRTHGQSLKESVVVGDTIEDVALNRRVEFEAHYLRKARQ